MADNFKDFPCLYYVNNRLERKDQVFLFSMLNAMFGKTPEQTVESSVFFSHASHLLGEKEIVDKEIEKNSNCFEKPYKDCRSFNKRKAFNAIHMLEKCCVMCPYSYNYQNALIEEERAVLSYYITCRHEARLSLAPENFHSWLPISCTNDISTLPLIPFNRCFFDYLASDKSADSSVDSVINYLRTRSDIDLSLVNENTLRSFVSLQLELIGRKNETDEDYISILCPKLITYSYDPPRLVRLVSEETSPKDVRNIAELSVLDELLALVNEVPTVAPEIPSVNSLCFECSDDEAFANRSQNISSVSEDIKKPENDEAISLVDNSLPVTPAETPPINSSFQVEKKDSDSYINHIVSSSEPTTDSAFLFDVDEELPCDVDIEYDFSEIEHGPVFPALSDEFRKIIYNATFNTENIVSLLARVSTTPEGMKSIPVSVERVMNGNADSLLFYIQNKYYSVAVSKLATRIVKPIFSSTNCKFYSANPIHVYSAFRTYGLPYRRIESVSVLHSIARHSANLIPLVSMFSVSSGIDIYRCTMPLYNEAVESSILDEPDVAKYERAIKLEWALAPSCDLSNILTSETSTITGGTAMDYAISFAGCENLCREGSLFLIRLRGDNLSQQEEKDYWEEVAGRVAASSNDTVKYSFIVGLGSGIAYFSCFDEEIFYESLMRSARAAYRKRYRKDADFNVTRNRFVGF